MYGKCPEHNKEPESRREEAYFFRLSKYKSQLQKIIPKYVVPESKQNEVLARMNEELTDICISRKGAEIGVDFPNDPIFKVWVWVDALINYISGLKDKEKRYWPADVHVIGKGINWFHSVIWPALLLSAGCKLPKTLVVHGYLNIGGKKMSKSLGNTLDPLELAGKYSADTIRYSLMRNSIFEDSDYSEELIITRHNNELANKLGNLISRVSALIEIHGMEKTNPISSKKYILNVKKHFKKYEVDKALNEIFAFVDYCNLYVQENKPWETKDKKILWQLANAIKDITILLNPFMPSTAEKISRTFKFEISLKSLQKPINPVSVKKADILFMRIQ